MAEKIRNRFGVSCLGPLMALTLALFTVLGITPFQGTAQAANWEVQTLDGQAADVGQYNSLAVDSDGYAHISYYDLTYVDLKYTYEDGRGWQNQVLDANGGLFTSIAMDDSDYPHMAYYDPVIGVLKHQFQSSSGWEIETVDEGTFVGLHNSLKIDSGGGVHLSYYHNFNRDLLYGYRSAEGWNLEVVDGPEAVGEYGSLAIDGQGVVHISYYDATNGALKHAYQDGSGWRLETVDSTGDVGKYTSLGIDSQGVVHISYYDAGNGDLKHAYGAGSGWRVESVDRSADVGQYTSLAVDSCGTVHIIYYDVSNGDLKHAYQDGAGWSLETVDSAGDVGRYTSLAVDHDDHLHVSYYDAGNDDLKYARMSNLPPYEPTLLLPVNGAANLSLTPTLQTGPFSDPDSGDTHTRTEWQFSNSFDFSRVAFARTSTENLTSFTVPRYVLEQGTTYYWRARFYDKHCPPSDWSDVFSFSTLADNRDLNGNGIPDDQEYDETVDLDDDGTPDVQQDDIKGVNTVVGEGRIGASRRDDPGVISVDSIESVDPDTIDDLARPGMELGLVVMKLTVANPGDTVRVTMYLSEPAPEGAIWFKFNPVTAEVIDYSDHATFSDDRMWVVLELQDGGYGDFDGVANGEILDPGGFGLASWIRGLVFDSATNQPIADAVVSILSTPLNTDASGNYLSLMLPGTYTVTVSATGYSQGSFSNVVVLEGGLEDNTHNFGLTVAGSGPDTGSLIDFQSKDQDLWIRAVINTEEKGPIEAVWRLGDQSTTARGDEVVWGHFYASPEDVSWGNMNNPDLYVKIWFDAGGRLDVNFFHVSVPDIGVYSNYPYNDSTDEQGTTTMSTRYIRQFYENGLSNSEEQTEDGNPPGGFSPSGDPTSYGTIENLNIGAMINTEELGLIDAIWQLGGTDRTAAGDQVVWGHFYASADDVSWGSSANPDLFVKVWFDNSGRIDVNFFHVSVPDIEVYSDYPGDGTYDQAGTTIMSNRYIRQEYQR